MCTGVNEDIQAPLNVDLHGLVEALHDDAAYVEPHIRDEFEVNPLPPKLLVEPAGPVLQQISCRATRPELPSDM